jgi:hypothetical protein
MKTTLSTSLISNVFCRSCYVMDLRFGPGSWSDDDDDNTLGIQIFHFFEERYYSGECKTV